MSCFHENEAEYGSEKVFTENKSSISFVLEVRIRSNFQDLFAKIFEINLSKQNFNNCNISNFQFFDSFEKGLL